MRDPFALSPGFYRYRAGRPDPICHVIAVHEGGLALFEYISQFGDVVGPNLVSSFSLVADYLGEPATEEDWLCCLLTR